MKINKIDIENSLYPKMLKNIKKPPKTIYAIGNIELFNEPGIAVIGSRNLSSYGLKNCESFAGGLAKRKINIISGMAIGIDTIAHLQAIKYGSPTIAVLGSGFNNVFPKENENLMDSILKNNGLVITEYAPDVKSKPENFRERNRIISGLSIGVLVIEASCKSGTSITVNYAKKEGKKVFALPGRLDLTNGKGVNKFIKEGAQLVTGVEEIINEYLILKNKNLPKDKCVSPKSKKNKNLILDFLEEGKSLEEVMWITQKDRKTTLKFLFELEMEGLIKYENGIGYIKI